MKVILKFFKLSLILGFIGLFCLLGIGYYEYHETIQNNPIDEVILEVRGSDHYTPLHAISETFLDAIVATEDHRYFEHHGIDFISLTRATLTNLTSGNIEQGGSTITQQLAKNLFLSGEQTLMRKVKEMFIAYELEKRYTKKEILELYVNIIYYGDGNTGIYAASKNYFGKTPLSLTYDEATLLAGLPQAPSYYALSKNPSGAKARQEQVIEALTTYLNEVDTDYTYAD